jgi:EpsI family protein
VSSRIGTKSIVVVVLMLVAAGGAIALKPIENLGATRPVENLETLIPEVFGDWSIDASVTPIEPAPDVRESLKKIYSQTLTRTYINKSGHRIMLSIAYGDGIDRQLDIHRPEYCYPSQGFEVSAYVDQVLYSAFGKIPLRRLVANQGSRVEPISYWITVGETAVSSTFERKLLKLRYGLTGQIGSGMLVRVSSINADKIVAYGDHDEFIRALIQGMPDSRRKQLIGERLSG